MIDKLIVGGTIVTSKEKFRGNVGVKDGKIYTITLDDTTQAKEVIDATGKYIIPGAIDAHVHFQDPGFTNREDFESATCAAALGGVTTAISHPMNIPAIVDEASYQFTIDAYEGRGFIDYGIHGGGTSTNRDKVEDLWNKTGATAIKMFMCFSVAEFPYVKDDALYDILKKLAKNNGLAIVHAENNELIALEEKRLKDEGRKDPMAYLQSHTEVGELESVKRLLYYLEITGATAVVLHSGMVSALKEIKAAQGRGVKVYAECCPHFLTFIDEDIKIQGPNLKFSPVMRGEKNRQELWKLLDEGYINTMGSDHSPYERWEKEKGREDIWKAPNGIPGIQTMLPVLLNGVSEGKLSFERLVEITSFNPANIYGLSHQKGSLSIGMDADLVVVDMEETKTYTEEMIASKAKWSPYVGRTFKGWPVLTMVRGEVIAKDGVITGQKGYGNYIPRKKQEE